MVITTTESQLRQEGARSANRISAQEFSALYESHRERLLISVTALVRNRDTAEDITAAAFAAALQHLDGFGGESSFYTWLYRIASNEVCTLRRRKPVFLQSIESLAVEPGERDKTEERYDRSLCRAKFHQAMRRIPAPCRRTLTDHLVDGRSVRDVARRNRIPVGTALSRIFTAKRALRQAWGRSD